MKCPGLVRERPGVWSVAGMMSFGETDLNRVRSFLNETRGRRSEIITGVGELLQGNAGVWFSALLKRFCGCCTAESG